MTRRSIAALLVLPALALATTRGSAQQAPAAADPSPRVLDVRGGQIRVVPVATGHFHPWSLGFLPDGSVLVAERNGRLRVIRNGVLAPEPIWTAPEQEGQGDGLHAVAVHPQFAENGFV
jgi:glucose/arabinose dehydrogenase